MGQFMTRTFTRGAWSSAHTGDAPFLSIFVHDSDLATVAYEPAPPGGGLVYLGFQPRDYFEDPAESDDVDLEEQAVGLVAWARTVVGTDVDADEIRPLLAEVHTEDPVDDFVEDTVSRLLRLLRLPVPEEFRLQE